MFVGSEGQAWSSFYESPQNNISMFLRNAVFYGNGNVQFYKSVGKIAETPIVFGSRVNGVRVRLAPSLTDNNIIDFTEELLAEANVAIYGWSDVSTSAQVPYWLLVADQHERLLWTASNGVTHDPNVLTTQNKIVNVADFSPDRPFAASDLDALLGV